MEHTRSGALDGELEDVWLPAARARVLPLPVDFPSAAANTMASAVSVSVALTEDETRGLLKEVPAVYRTEINDALLCALALTLNRWTGSPSALIDLEGHGRELLFDDVDLSRTVGWFTTQFPVLLSPGKDVGIGAALGAVKEQLRRIPHHGIGYGLLRYIGEGERLAVLRRAPAPQVSFNYLGQFDQVAARAGPFQPAAEATGAARSPRGRRTHLLEVSGRVAGGRLGVNFNYSDRVHRRATVQRLADDFAAALRELLRQCREGGDSAARAVTAEDFPLARLNEKTFQKLSALLADE